MPKKRELKTITISTVNGPKEVEAYVTSHPNFFVHRTPEDPKAWTVCHIPSGFAVSHNIKGFDKAFKIAGAISGLNLKWNKIRNQQKPSKQLTPIMHQWVRALAYWPMNLDITVTEKPVANG